MVESIEEYAARMRNPFTNLTPEEAEELHRELQNGCEERHNEFTTCLLCFDWTWLEEPDPETWKGYREQLREILLREILAFKAQELSPVIDAEKALEIECLAFLSKVSWGAEDKEFYREGIRRELRQALASSGPSHLH